MKNTNPNIDGDIEPGALAAFAANHGLKLIQRGAHYGRLMLGDRKLAVARGTGWVQRLRAWLEGWVQAQAVHEPIRVDGRVSVTVDMRQFDITYHWVMSASLVPALSKDLDWMVQEHVPDEIMKGATRGLMGGMEQDGGMAMEIHGWWYSGDEEEKLAAVERTKWKAWDEAQVAYLGLLRAGCQLINDQYDTAAKSGLQIFLARAGQPRIRITGHAVQGFAHLTVPVLDGGRRFKLKVGSAERCGIGAGAYRLESSGGNCVEVVIPSYPPR